jgi:pimeloyl-ACP methyl ester carboxylesterase
MDAFSGVTGHPSFLDDTRSCLNTDTRGVIVQFLKNATVILVHGAWADGSSWGTVFNRIAETGLGVLCAPIPLTSLCDDIAQVRRVVERIDGPVVLVAHAYAGAVIAGVDDDKIKALVYITALAPDEGETSKFSRERLLIPTCQPSPLIKTVSSGCPAKAPQRHSRRVLPPRSKFAWRRLSAP